MRTKSFISGVLATLLLVSLVGTAVATVGKNTIEVDYLDIRVTLNGESLDLKDAGGASVEPFAYRGTTYLPVRSVSEALDLSVEWDGKTSTVALTQNEQPDSNGADLYIEAISSCFEIYNSCYHFLRSLDALDLAVRGILTNQSYSDITEMFNRFSLVFERGDGFLNDLFGRLLEYDNSVLSSYPLNSAVELSLRLAETKGKIPEVLKAALDYEDTERTSEYTNYANKCLDMTLELTDIMIDSYQTYQQLYDDYYTGN